MDQSVFNIPLTKSIDSCVLYNPVVNKSLKRKEMTNREYRCSAPMIDIDSNLLIDPPSDTNIALNTVNPSRDHSKNTNTKTTNTKTTKTKKHEYTKLSKIPRLDLDKSLRITDNKIILFLDKSLDLKYSLVVDNIIFL